MADLHNHVEPKCREPETRCETPKQCLLNGCQELQRPVSAPTSCELNEAPYQERVGDWMDCCFGPEISSDKVERGDRLLEEVFELLQSGGYSPSRITPLMVYVWDRPVGEAPQEVGGVMVTLAAYCNAFGLDLDDAAETELDRVWTKVDQIREKQARKAAAIPFSPLPQESTPAGAVGRLEAFAEVLDGLEGVARGEPPDLSKLAYDPQTGFKDCAADLKLVLAMVKRGAS